MNTFFDSKTVLEALRDAVTEAWEELTAAVADESREHEREELSAAHDAAQDEFGEDEQTELAEIEEISTATSSFRDGEAMIPVEDFEEYAEQLAEDTGAIDRNASWPLNHIDWTAAAEALSADYTEVSYQGTDYYVRA